MKLKIILIIAGISLSVFAVWQLRSAGIKSSQPASLNQAYSASDKEKPVLTVEPEDMVKDMGRMKVNEDRSAEFILRNDGSKPLLISNPYTSCMCTFGQITIGGRQSPNFGMAGHGNPRWQGVLEPGQMATAKVTYKPYLMPVQGPVERLFIFETNDPLNSEVNLIIKAVVE